MPSTRQSGRVSRTHSGYAVTCEQCQRQVYPTLPDPEPPLTYICRVCQYTMRTRTVHLAEQQEEIPT